MTTTLNPLADHILVFLNEESWSFSQLEDRTIFRLIFQGTQEQWQVFLEAKEEARQFLCYSVSPRNTPLHKLAVMSEFLTRANYGLLLGNFELDWIDGEVRFKTSLDVMHDELTASLVRRAVLPNIRTMDHYLSCVFALINHDLTPLEALALAE